MLETVSKRGCMIYKQEAHEPQRPPEYQRHRNAIAINVLYTDRVIE